MTAHKQANFVWFRIDIVGIVRIKDKKIWAIQNHMGRFP